MWNESPNNTRSELTVDGARPQLPPVVDIHCHCLPCLDDGPSSMDSALSLCRQMVADGTSIAIATTHQLGSYEKRNTADEIRFATEQLNQLLTKNEIPLKVLPGAEVRIDGRLMELLESDFLLTLADQRRHLLLELPSEPLIDLQSVIKLLSNRQITVIVAHPERQVALRRRFDLLRRWAEMGAALQINAASLVGLGTAGDSEMAWRLVDQGLVDFVASDCHSATRRPSVLGKAHKMLAKRVGYSAARRICLDNPAAIVAGESIRTWRSLPKAQPAALPATGVGV